MRKAIIIGLFFVLLMSGAVSADTIYLKNGKKINGEIYEDMGYAVKVNVKGTLKTYFEREIERIERTTPKKKGPDQDKPAEKRSLKKIEKDKKELINRLLIANGARDSMMGFFTKMVATLSKEDREKVKDVIVVDKLIEAIIPVYDRHFSAHELRSMINFYSSPAGKKTVKRMPVVLDEAMQAAMEYFRDELKEGQ